MSSGPTTAIDDRKTRNAIGAKPDRLPSKQGLATRRLEYKELGVP
ncbi:MAG: hypothetical protein ACI8TX_002452, partial [Hyphomicrobiaceae bacterium]